MTESKLKFCVGIVLRGWARKYLNDCVFYCDGLTWTESKGFLESWFYIKGPTNYINQMKKQLLTFVKEDDEDED